ncbi:TPA: hypothetical protein KQG29_001573 [Clostridioides difficile]|nr:hypothetical protein [Clostridioides difficile]
MNRYKILESEINKGILIDEKNNVLINNWTPNNVRRIIIGSSEALVQYYVTEGKYKEKIKLVKFGNKMECDVALLNKNKYSSILKVLTSKRVLSSVEEIIFCTKDYNLALLDIDINQWIFKERKSLSTRFVRLHSISLVDCSVLDVASIINRTIGPEQLLISELNKKYKLNIVEKIHEYDWYLNTKLRDYWYSMDKEGGKLERYFNSLKLKKEKEYKLNKLKNIEIKKLEKLWTSYGKNILFLVREINKCFNTMEKIFYELSYIEKFEWGRYLNYQFTKKMLIDKYGDNLEKIRSIDISTLLEHINIDEKDSKDMLLFKDILYNKILKNSEYKMEYKKMATEDSILEYLNLLNTILYKILFNSCNLAFISYLTREGTKYIDYQINILNIGNTFIEKYTKKDLELYNSYEDESKVHHVYKNLSAKLVKDKDCSIQERINIINNILNMFECIYLSK